MMDMIVFNKKPWRNGGSKHSPPAHSFVQTQRMTQYESVQDLRFLPVFMSGRTLFVVSTNQDHDAYVVTTYESSSVREKMEIASNYETRFVETTGQPTALLLLSYRSLRLVVIGTKEGCFVVYDRNTRTVQAPDFNVGGAIARMDYTAQDINICLNNGSTMGLQLSDV